MPRVERIIFLWIGSVFMNHRSYLSGPPLEANEFGGLDVIGGSRQPRTKVVNRKW